MPIDIKEANFQTEAIEKSKDKPVLVDFWAPWCGPCKMLAPHLEDIAKSLGDKVSIVKINVDENPQTAAQFGIRSIPTLILFKGGNPVETKVGVPPISEITNLIEKNM